MVQEKERPPMLSAMLAQVRPGTDVEAAETLRKVIAAVQDTGKVGSLVIRLDVKPADGGIDAVVEYGVTPSNISQIVTGRIWKHIGVAA